MKELIKNVPTGFKGSAVFKHAKKGTKSFRVTQQLVQSIFTQAKKLKNVPVLILTIPANKKENYTLTCYITKTKL